MENHQLEQIITAGIKIGTIATLKSLGLLSEVVTKKEAEKIYSKRLVEDWRRKGWITGYPSGNSLRGKIYFKRSELEIASATLSVSNVLLDNEILKLNLFNINNRSKK